MSRDRNCAGGCVRACQVVGPAGVRRCPDPLVACRGSVAYLARWRTALLAAVVASCGSPETGSDPVPALDMTNPATWIVDPVPTWSLPDESHGPEYDFHLARGLRRLSNGTVVLLNAGTRELRAFASDGQLLWRTGAAGDGPGDFRNPRWIELLPGDTLMVEDSQLYRLSYFNASGELVRTEPLTEDLGCSTLSPGLRAGLMVAATCSSWQLQEPGLHRRDRTLTLVSPSLRGGSKRLARVSGEEMVVLPNQNYTFPAFGLAGVLAARDSLIFYGTAEQFAVEVYSISGRRLRTIGLARSRQPVTRELKGEWYTVQTRRLQQMILQRGGTPGTEAGGRVPEPVFRDSVPAYGEFRVDPDLNLWIGEYALTGRQPVRWTVLSAEGRLLAEVTVPERFRIWEVGRDYLLGVWRDENDVERVQMYRIQRGP